jgi:hypothetical protein
MADRPIELWLIPGLEWMNLKLWASGLWLFHCYQN